MAPRRAERARRERRADPPRHPRASISPAPSEQDNPPPFGAITVPSKIARARGVKALPGSGIVRFLRLWEQVGMGSASRDRQPVVHRRPDARSPGRAPVGVPLLSVLGNRRIAGMMSSRRACLSRAHRAVLQRKATFDLYEWHDEFRHNNYFKTHPALDHIWALLRRADPLVEDDPSNVQARAAIGQLLDELLSANDVQVVTSVLRANLGHSITAGEVALVKRHDFASGLISFTAENYLAWRRLAIGRPRVDDIRYFVHELTAVREAARRGFDVTGRRDGPDDYDDDYLPSHQVALLEEMRFLAASVGQIYGYSVTWQQVAASDVQRREEFLPALDQAAGAARAPGVPNLNALSVKFAHYHDPVLAQMLTSLKLRRGAGFQTQVYSYRWGVTASPNPGSYYAAIGFLPVATDIGPVWVDPRNRAILERLHPVSPDASWSYQDNRDEISDDEEPGEEISQAIVLPDRKTLIDINREFESGAVNADYFDVWGSMAKRQSTLEAKVAYYTFSIVRGHAFLDGNKRTGLAALRWIARNNGRGELKGDAQRIMQLAADARSGYTSDRMAEDLKEILKAPRSSRR